MMAAFLSSSRSSSPRSVNNSRSNTSLALCRWISPSWLLFLLGCILGHFHGRFSNELTASPYAPVLVQLVNPAAAPLPLLSCVPDGNGWNSIQVFYGRLDPFGLDEDFVNDKASAPSTNLSSSIPDAEAAAAVESRRLSNQERSNSLNAPRHRWYGQARQDELVHALLRNKTNGFFVDLAANDATLLSNTYALETFYNWKGVCIEPNPLYWSNLTLLRPNCTIIGAVVGAQRLQQVHFRFEAGDHGGIADAGFDNGKRWQRNSELRYTVPLLEILRHRVPGGSPTDIDYLSLDVEGTNLRYNQGSIVLPRQWFVSSNVELIFYSL